MKMNLLRFALPFLGVAFYSQVGHAKDAATTCAKELARVAGTAAYNPASSDLEKADCEQRNVLCVDFTGYPLSADRGDPRLLSGESLTVKLFGPKSCEGLLTVGTNLHLSGVTLFSPSAGADDKAGEPDAAASIEIEQLAKSSATTDLTVDSVTVFVSRKDIDASVEGITLVVTPPRYYLDVGVLAAFTPDFQQVTTQRAPGSQETFVRETNTVRAAAAITLNYFPAGQYAAPRFSGLHGLGFQAGIGGNLDRIDDEFYLGALWEPIPGAGVSAGLALLTMERLQPHYPSGALVSPDDVPKDTFLGPRFYFGVSLNTQVFQTLLSLGAKARVPN